MSYAGDLRQQKRTQHAPSMEAECDYLNAWIKKWSHSDISKKNLTQNSEPQRIGIAGESRRRRMCWKRPVSFLLTVFNQAVIHDLCEAK